MAFSDYSVQKRVRDGDIAEFEKMFLKYYEPLCLQALSIVKDMAVAEDIVQEFFYNFWKNRASFSPRLALAAYLHRSVRNNSLHYIRHQAVEQDFTAHALSQAGISAVSDEPLELQGKELGSIIEETLRQMPSRCSLIFRMNRFEGKKYREIAESLSVSVKTVEAEMGRALQVFRKVLAEYTTERTGQQAVLPRLRTAHLKRNTLNCFKIQTRI